MIVKRSQIKPWANVGTISDLYLLTGSIAAYNVAIFAWWLQPHALSTLIRGSRLSETLAGLIAAVELGLVAASSFIAARLVTHIPFRNTALVMCIICFQTPC